MKPGFSFGEKVRSLREARRIDLRQFAAAVGMSATYLSKIERGDLLPLSEEKIRAIARQFAADEDEFPALAGRLPSDLWKSSANNRGRWLRSCTRTAG